MTRIPRPCIVSGCKRPANVPGSARGMCIAHYNRVRRTGDPECFAPGCHEPIRRFGEAGFCAYHAASVVGL